MTSTQHGLAELAENVFMGSMAVELKVHGESILMSDREFRDVLLCARDLFPSMFQWQLPEQEYVRAADNGDPTATVPDGVEGLSHERGGNWITVPVKSCCGLLASDGCDCAEFAAEASAAFESPLRFGWSR